MSYTNSVDPDQMPHVAASDLGLHCLRMLGQWNRQLLATGPFWKGVAFLLEKILFI